MTVTLKTARDLTGLSQEKIAQRAGLSVRTYMRLETGQTPNPSFETVLAISDALGVKPSEITEFQGLVKTAERVVGNG